jgi:hypothetical protein
MAIVTPKNAYGQEVDVNEHGAKQAKIAFRHDLVDDKAQRREAIVLAKGVQDYGLDNWRGIPIADHISHAIDHLYKAANGVQDGEDHFAHAMCRVMFACAIDSDPVGNWQKYLNRPTDGRVYPQRVDIESE